MFKKSISFAVIILLLSTCCLPGIKPLLGENNKNGLLSKPVADTNGPYYGVINQPITFDGSNSYDTDGIIILYNWFFGDYTNETGIIVNHSYAEPGVYLLTLLIIDNDNNFGCDETIVTIYEDTPPKLELIHPIEKSIYFNDFYLFPYDKDTILIGKINITANATDDVGINRVEFYLNDNLQHTDFDKPYTWIMPENHLRHYINVVAYDSTEKQTNIQLEFFQWKIHPVFIILTCYILLKNKGDGLNWISNENEFNSLIIKLLKNLANIDNSDAISLREFIEILQNQNDDIKTSIIIDFLNNHPYLKNKFKKTYPFMYFILFYIKNEDSILRDKILHSFYKDKNLISILFSIPSLIEIIKPSNKILDTTSLDNSLIELIKDHPIITVSMLLLLILFVRNLITDDSSDNEAIDEPEIENIAPVAIAKGPYLGYLNKPINFSAEGSYDSDGKISVYNWDFGDGNNGSGINIQHTYSNLGYYTVTLLIIDDEGQINYDNLNIEIVNSEEKPININDKNNIDYILISGILSSLLLIGLIGLKVRRKFFE